MALGVDTGRLLNTQTAALGVNTGRLLNTQTAALGVGVSTGRLLSRRKSRAVASGDGCVRAWVVLCTVVCRRGCSLCTMCTGRVVRRGNVRIVPWQLAVGLWLLLRLLSSIQELDLPRGPRFPRVKLSLDAPLLVHRRRVDVLAREERAAITLRRAASPAMI